MYDKNIWNYDFEIFRLILINLMKLLGVHYVISDKMRNQERQYQDNSRKWWLNHMEYFMYLDLLEIKTNITI
jgi:hypothetical protein